MLDVGPLASDRVGSVRRDAVNTLTPFGDDLARRLGCYCAGAIAFARVPGNDDEGITMNVTQKLWIAAVYLAQGPVVLAAQVEPTDPTASAPPTTYRSAFEGYRPFREEPIADWRALNAEVGAAGGHIGIMGGAGGHAGHGAAKPAAGKPVVTEGGQPPVRGAPKAPGGGAPKASGGGAHSGH